MKVAPRLVKVAVMLMALVPMLATVPVAQAANIPMYDNNVSRTRLIVDPSFSPVTLFLSSPTYIHLQGESVSTPTINGSDLYQYTYSGPVGTLYDIRVPQIDTTSIMRRYGYSLPSYLTASAQVVHTLTFRPSEGSYGADAQDSLSTAQGYQSISVGQRLYAWPQGNWPSAPQTAPVRQLIQGNPTNNLFAVDMNVLITPPVPTRIYDLTANRAETISTPRAVACSWDGGCIAWPLGLSSKQIPLQKLSYQTTQDFPNDAQGAITSDPVYIASDPMFSGQPAVAFGIASWTAPRVEVMDLITGQAKAIGVGQIAAPIADAGMLTSGPGGERVLVYHDEFGNIYEFNLRGALVGVWPSHTTSVQFGVDGSLSYPTLTGSTGTVFQPVQGTSQVATVPVAGQGSGAYLRYIDASSPTTVEGSMPNLPWCKPSKAIPDTSYCKFVTAWSFGDSVSNSGVHSGPGIVVLSAAAGSAYIHTATYSNGGQLLAAKTAQYVSVLLDAGSQHDMISWSNSSPVGTALEIWSPVKYGVTAQATSSIPSGGTVTVSAHPIPAGVTHDRLNWHPCNTGISPVSTSLTSSLGSSGALSLTRTVTPTASDPWSTWSATYTLPSNDTGHAVTWSGTVTAEDKFCTTATASISFTELPALSSPQPTSGGPLTLDPNPSLWSQPITATLSPSVPTLPAGETLVSWSIASATMSYPKKSPQWAVGLPYYPAGTVQIPMILRGHQAGAMFAENWWDGGGCTTIGCNSRGYLVRNGLLGLLPGSSPAAGEGVLYPSTPFIMSMAFPVSAVYSLTVTESHKVTTCKAETDSTTEAKETSTDKEQVCSTRTVTTTFTATPQQAQANLKVDGTAKNFLGGG